MEPLQITGVERDQRFKAMVKMLVNTARKLSPEARAEFLEYMKQSPEKLTAMSEGNPREQFISQLLQLLRTVVGAELDNDDVDLWDLVEEELMTNHLDKYVALNVTDEQ
jgi:hypothetical protein